MIHSLYILAVLASGSLKHNRRYLLDNKSRQNRWWFQPLENKGPRSLGTTVLNLSGRAEKEWGMEMTGCVKTTGEALLLPPRGKEYTF